jgi:acetyltransferase-like isoleucine patch superfamily enzyme
MKLATLAHIVLVPMPSFLKKLAYRWFFGYQVGSGVKIGFSILDVDRCILSDGSRIGHFNFIHRIGVLSVGRAATIGHLNVLMGGAAVIIGDRAFIGRLNEINSIINPLADGLADPQLVIGEAAVITAWHKIDYTDRVVIGANAIIAGRSSCLWTHNRQQVRPVEVGRNCYVGSGVQFVPGSAVGDYCVVGLGAVVTRRFTEQYSLVAGVPAKVIKELSAADRVLVEFPTRPGVG